MTRAGTAGSRRATGPWRSALTDKHGNEVGTIVLDGPNFKPGDVVNIAPIKLECVQ